MIGNPALNTPVRNIMRSFPFVVVPSGNTHIFDEDSEDILSVHVACRSCVNLSRFTKALVVDLPLSSEVI